MGQPRTLTPLTDGTLTSNMCRVAKGLSPHGGLMIDTVSGAPENYQELFEEYWGFVKAHVARAGIAPQDVEQVAMDIMTTFLAKDALSWYDPEMLHDTEALAGRPKQAVIAGPRMRKARFSSFLGRFVNLYVRQHKDKQNTRSFKEPIRCEQPVLVGDGEALSWLDRNGPETGLESDLEHDDWVGSVADYLDELEVRGKRDLARLFRMLVEQANNDGVANRKAIAAEFQVSDTAVCHMVKDLRVALEDAGWVHRDSAGSVLV